MAKLLLHIYGLIPADFIDVELEFEGPVNLRRLEEEIIKRYGNKIEEQYISEEGLLNHRFVITGDKYGKKIDYQLPDLTPIEEIWFAVPLAGG
jgi:hypothetical protein